MIIIQIISNYTQERLIIESMGWDGLYIALIVIRENGLVLANLLGTKIEHTIVVSVHVVDIMNVDVKDAILNL